MESTQFQRANGKYTDQDDVLVLLEALCKLDDLLLGHCACMCNILSAQTAKSRWFVFVQEKMPCSGKLTSSTKKTAKKILKLRAGPDNWETITPSDYSPEPSRACNRRKSNWLVLRSTPHYKNDSDIGTIFIFLYSRSAMKLRNSKDLGLSREDIWQNPQDWFLPFQKAARSSHTRKTLQFTKINRGNIQDMRI